MRRVLWLLGACGEERVRRGPTQVCASSSRLAIRCSARLSRASRAGREASAPGVQGGGALVQPRSLSGPRGSAWCLRLKILGQMARAG